MSFYHKYLLCYDIEDNKVRRRFYNELKDLGLIPIQRSVFWGQLCQAEYNCLQRISKDLLNPSTDRCFWIVTQLSENDLKEGIGYDAFQYIPADGYFSV